VRERSSKKQSRKLKRASRGRADLARVSRMTEAETRRMAAPELTHLPQDFWDEGALVMPAAKQAISLRVDEDVLDWFKRTGPRYQTRMNAVLRSYMARMRKPGAPSRAIAPSGKRGSGRNSEA
jgi:uncharacterized protein (DUF4415 family)